MKSGECKTRRVVIGSKLETFHDKAYLFMVVCGRELWDAQSRVGIAIAEEICLQGEWLISFNPARHGAMYRVTMLLLILPGGGANYGRAFARRDDGCTRKYNAVDKSCRRRIG